MPSKPKTPKSSPCLETLDKSGLIRDLTPAEGRLLAQLGEERKFAKGRVIFREDTKTRDLFVIKSGKVCVRLTLPSSVGREESLSTLRQGDVFGELALVDGSPRSATVEAELALTVFQFDYDRLLQLLNEHPRIGYILMRNIAGIIAGRVRVTNLMWRNALIW